MTKILTHNGVFHADEVAAIALIKLYVDDNIKVIRSRDEDLMGHVDLVIDVGGLFDGEKYFDHHQFTEKDRQYGLSSAGLILEKILEEAVVNSEIIDLIIDIDNQDVGIKRNDEFHFCNIISRMNEEDVSGEAQDKAFNEAVNVAYRVFKNMKIKYDKIQIAKKIPLQLHNDVEIAVLKKDELFIPAELFVGKADLVIQYDKLQNNWSIQTVPLKKGEFGSKYSLESTNLKEEVFIHKAGFISKNNVNKADEIKIKVKDIEDLITIKVQ